VFLEDGFAASTMERVAAVAEVSKGTVYLYFESKDDLRSAIAERWITSLIARLATKLETRKAGIEGLAAVLEAMDEHFTDNPSHCQMTLSWLAVEGPPGNTPSLEGHKARVGEFVALVVEQVVRGQADGTVRRDVDPPMVALNLWATTLGLQLIARNRAHIEERAPFPIRFENMVRTYQRIMLSGLRAEEEVSAA
jgi:AcrR family transcriptional regulator